MTDLSPSDIEAWNQIWADVHSRRYDCLYEELLAEKLLNKFTPIDVSCRILIACTASGSTIAGWALWEEEGFKKYWLAIAGAAAVISIVHTVVGISDSVRQISDLHASFRSLRLKFDAMITRMKICQHESLASYKSEFAGLLEEYGNVGSRKKPCILITDNLEETVQKQLNKQLGYDAH
jgi:hypothetical protein